MCVHQVYAFKDVERLGRSADLIQLVVLDHKSPMMSAGLHAGQGEAMLQHHAMDELANADVLKLLSPTNRHGSLISLKKFCSKHGIDCDEEDGGQRKKVKTQHTEARQPEAPNASGGSSDCEGSDNDGASGKSDGSSSDSSDESQAMWTQTNGTTMLCEGLEV